MRQVAIQYGDYEITGQGSVQFVRTVSYSLDLTRGVLDFEFLVVSADGSGFATAEAAFRERNRDFTMSIGDTPVVEWTPSNNTGASLVEPLIRKTGQATDSPRSRVYRVTITAELVADLQTRQGERPWQITLAYNEDRVRTLTLSGEFTATADGASHQVYEGRIDGIVTRAQSMVPAPDVMDWNIQSESVETDDEQSVTRYTLAFVEATSGGTIVYGGFTVGGSAFPIIGTLEFVHNYEDIYVRAEVLVQAETADELAANSDAMLAAFRLPRQDLSIFYGGTPVFEGEQEAGTILNADPSIQRTGNPSHAGLLARTFEIEVRAKLPADNLGTEGRRHASLGTEYTGSRRRRVTISGVYTAYDETPTGTESYHAAIEAFVETILDTEEEEPTTWELVDESLDEFETRKELEFSRTYQELFHQPRAGGKEEAGWFVDQKLTLHLQNVATEDSDPRDPQSTDPSPTDMRRPAVIRASCAAHVNHDLVTDGESYDRAAELLQQYALTELYTRFTPTMPAEGRWVVLQRTREEARDDWDLVVSVEVMATDTPWIKYRYTEKVEIDVGQTVERGWDGSPNAVYVYAGLQGIRANCIEEGEWIGTLPGGVHAMRPPMVKDLTAFLQTVTVDRSQVGFGFRGVGDGAEASGHAQTKTIWQRQQSYIYGKPLRDVSAYDQAAFVPGV